MSLRLKSLTWHGLQQRKGVFGKIIQDASPTDVETRIEYTPARVIGICRRAAVSNGNRTALARTEASRDNRRRDRKIGAFSIHLGAIG